MATAENPQVAEDDSKYNKQKRLIVISLLGLLFLFWQVIYMLELASSPLDEFPEVHSLQSFNPALYERLSALEKKIYEDNPGLHPFAGIYVVPHILRPGYRRNPVPVYYDAMTFYQLNGGRWYCPIVFTKKIVEEFPAEYVEAIFAHEIGHIRYHFPISRIWIIETFRAGFTRELEVDCFAARYTSKKTTFNAFAHLIRAATGKEPRETPYYKRLQAIETLCK